jgi:hypothetical protein
MMKKHSLFLRAEREYKYGNTEKGFLNIRIKDIFKPSAVKRRGCSPECTKAEIRKYFYEYVEEHGRNCFYCKEPWTYIINRYVIGKGANLKSDKGKSRKSRYKNFSMDRLDSSKPYSINNIIFCCTECNLSKRDISFKTIRRLYEIITERNL